MRMNPLRPLAIALAFVATTALAAPGPALTVNAGAARKAIADDIYGMNYAPEALAAELRLPVRRWGGNSTTRYNWQLNVHNTGADYYYENIPGSTAPGQTLPNGSQSDQFVEQDRRTGTRTIMTIPTIGYVAKRRLANHPYDCAFKVSKYGAQQSVDPFDTDCGNGKLPNGTDIVGNDPLDTSVAVTAAFGGAWVTHLKNKYGAAGAGGVAYYSLDNEPALWNSTHRDIHPNPLTLDELRDRSWAYGAAIKAADPTAKTLGPAEWGWCNYIYSAADPGGCGPGPDRAAHGNLDTVVWYLQQMKAYEVANGVRILDYLDLHFYPQQSGVALSAAGNAATQALRLRSTRGLWDPAYIDESWISDLAPGGIAIRMVPRMKEWVTANYPGTKLAITEYNFGGLEHINGALAQAEVLGVFGREGLDLATMWDPPTTGQPGAYAFRIYRNYDGASKGFGETSVSATSADPSSLSVFAAQRTADNALTLVVVNKTASDLTSALSLAGFTPTSPAQVWRYSGANLNAIVRQADQAVTPSGFSATFPANSITLVVMAAAPSTADLSVTQSAPATGATGKDTVVNVTVTNAGPAVATSVVLSDALPAGEAFVWASPGCTQASGTVTCALGTLAAGASAQKRIVFRPATAGAKSNVATVTAAETDPVPGNNTSNASVNVSTSPAGAPVQRYRLYSPVTKEHLYTTDLNEYNVLGALAGTWTQEGPVGKVYNNPGSFNGVTATPYYRLYNTSNAQHHWTTDSNEYYTLGLFPQYASEGVDGFIFPSQATGTIPLYRLMYPFAVPVAGLHHWTIDAVEYNALIASFGWVGEGGSGFVIP